METGTEADALRRRSLHAALAIAALALPTQTYAVSAADNLSITVTNTPINLGKLVRSNATDTTFSVDNAGAVTGTANAGVRVGTGNANVLQFVLDCVQGTSTTKCATGSKSYTFSISTGTPTGGSSLSKFRFGSISSNATAATASGTNPLSFTFSINSGSSNNWPVTVTLGYDYLVPSTARGAASAPYSVTLTQN